MAQAQQGAVRPGDRPSVRARLAGATAALGVLLTLGACSPAGSPEPAPTTTASSPSPTPSPEPTLEETAEPSPEPSPSTTDPNDRSELLVEPEEMQREDEYGAIAAAKYFMGLFEYIYLTGDLAKWEEMSLKGCAFCEETIEDVRQMHSTGEYVVTGTPEWLGEPSVRALSGGPRWEVSLEARVPAASAYNSQGDIIAEFPKGTQRVVLAMQITAGSWGILDVDMRSNG